MTRGRAIAVFHSLDSENYTENEKAEAIYEIMHSTTMNGITKRALVVALKWLWHQRYEFVAEQTEPQTERGGE